MALLFTYPEDIGDLVTALHDTKLLILGEIHGVEENVHIIESIIEKHTLTQSRPLVLAFEWLLETTEIAELNRFIHGETDTFPNATFFSASDGRFTVTHRALFNDLRQKPKRENFTIEVFDTDTNKEYERLMSNNLITICENHPDALVIAETGVIHARKTAYSDGHKNVIKPMAAYLPSSLKIKTVFIRYKSGEVDVEGKIHNITRAASQIEGAGEAFDYELCVERAHRARSMLDK